MSNKRRLIRGACVITMDPALGTLKRADILIEGEQIRAVEPDIAVEDCEVIDGTNMIAIPGFVDADLPRILDRLNASRDYLLEEWRKRDNTAIIEMIASIMPLG